MSSLSTLEKLANTVAPSTTTSVKVAATADGVNIVAAATTGKQIRVVSYCLNTKGTGTQVFNFEDTTGTPVEWGAFEVATGATVSFAGSPYAPAFTIASGKGLNIRTATGQDVTGHLTYILV